MPPMLPYGQNDRRTYGLPYEDFIGHWPFRTDAPLPLSKTLLTWGIRVPRTTNALRSIGHWSSHAYVVTSESINPFKADVLYPPHYISPSTKMGGPIMGHRVLMTNNNKASILPSVIISSFLRVSNFFVNQFCASSW